MIVRTIKEFDLRHTGDDMDRLEILGAIRALMSLIPEDEAEITLESVKTDLIELRIETVSAP